MELPPEATLIKQGAEARVYVIPFTSDRTAIVKERFRKSYRHPVLDEKLTARRVIQEARCLQKLRKAEVDTPALYIVDVKNSLIYMENINGGSVRDFIAKHTPLEKTMEVVLAQSIGRTLAKMHDNDIVHGDLTTSNMMLRVPLNKLVLIDFGLSMVSNMLEDKAVDLYVLERAMVSTHVNSESMFAEIIATYASTSRTGAATIKKLDEVRRRGRKRTAFG
ncbi:kinase-like domain-containing protein [Phlyctochytrium arcticum]|nr:kinase-like domain-containing protein [Phlyctochytrium arcticum]